MTSATTTLQLLKAEAFSLVLAMPDTGGLAYSAQILTNAKKVATTVIQMLYVRTRLAVLPVIATEDMMVTGKTVTPVTTTLYLLKLEAFSLVLAMSDIEGVEYSAQILTSALKKFIIAIRMQLAQTPKEALSVFAIEVMMVMGKAVKPVTPMLRLLKQKDSLAVRATSGTEEVEHSAQTLTSALKEPMIVIQMQVVQTPTEASSVHVIEVTKAMG